MEEPSPDTIQTGEMEPKTLVQKMAAMVVLQGQFFFFKNQCHQCQKYNIVVKDNGKFQSVSRKGQYNVCTRTIKVHTAHLNLASPISG